MCDVCTNIQNIFVSFSKIYSIKKQIYKNKIIKYTNI